MIHEGDCNNCELVLAAVHKNGWALPYASDTLRSDRELVLAAVHPLAYGHRDRDVGALSRGRLTHTFAVDSPATPYMSGDVVRKGTGTQKVVSHDTYVRDGRLFATTEAMCNVGLFSSLRSDNIEHAVALAEQFAARAREEREARELWEATRQPDWREYHDWINHHPFAK